MKKLLIVLFSLFVLLFSSSVVAKEYKTIFQFSVNIPENYIGINEVNIDDITNILKSETDINISAFNSLLQETGINFLFESGNVADVTCYDFSEEKGNIDQMRMGISSQELFEWTNEWVSNVN